VTPLRSAAGCALPPVFFPSVSAAASAPFTDLTERAESDPLQGRKIRLILCFTITCVRAENPYTIGIYCKF
jgi:hypothetical protein